MSLLDCDFDSEYEVMFSAWGEGELKAGDPLPLKTVDSYLDEYRKKHRRFPRDISLLLEDPMASGCDYGYTSIDPAMLEKLLTLKELVLPDSVVHIGVTPEVRRILSENRTLIRGSFDSYAERFAAENGLNFRPRDLVFAESFFEPAWESTTLILMFMRCGSAQIKERISSPGTSSSNTLGGNFYYKLKRDFYRSMTAEDVAGLLRPSLFDAVISDGRLASFIEKARSHGYYSGRN